MPFKSEKQRKWMWANDPEMAKKWEKEEKKMKRETKVRSLIRKMVREITKEGFAGGLKKEDRKKFDKNRRKQSEVLGYKLTGTDDLKSSICDATVTEGKLTEADSTVKGDTYLENIQWALKKAGIFSRFKKYKVMKGRGVTGRADVGFFITLDKGIVLPLEIRKGYVYYEIEDSHKLGKWTDINKVARALKKFSKMDGFGQGKLVKKEGKLDEKAKRDYKDEYKKFQSSTKSKKYRAELNKYNRQKGTYGNGDGKDASHRGGKIVGFEKESVNRGRAEKSRLKKEGKLNLIDLINEKKKLDQRFLDDIHKMTQRNNHTLARFQLAKYMGNNKLSKFYAAMEQLNDVFGGYGPELSKLNQMMEKELYKDIKRNYSNAKDIIGSL